MGELIVIFIIALIFIGPKKLPELAKGLGQGIKEFQKAAKGFTDQMHENEEKKSLETPVSEVERIADAARKDDIIPEVKTDSEKT